MIQPPPGPRGLPLLGDVLRFGGRQNILFQFIDIWREYGDLCRLRLGPYQLHLVAEPDNVHHVLVRNGENYIKGRGYRGFRLLVGNGLVTSDGDLWRQQRRLMQPSFTPRAIETFFAMMVETIGQTLDGWAPGAGGDAILAVDEAMARLTMAIISKTIFGVHLDGEDDRVSRAFQAAFAFVTARTMSAFPLPLALPLPAHRRFLRDRRVIDTFVDRQIAGGRRDGDGESLLSLLLQARDGVSGRGMSPREVRDEAVTLFLAGFETTARSLTWGWYLLSRHPRVLEQLEAEVDRVLGGRPPTLADLPHLTYTRMVVDETLRLYPPTALLARQAVADDAIAGYRVPSGSLVMLIPYLTHRLPRVWPDPERFDPRRFGPGIDSTRPRSSYIPFANGPRICLGNHFALMEMVLTVAMVVSRYRLLPRGEGAIDAEFRGSICPVRPLRLGLRPRPGRNPA